MVHVFLDMFTDNSNTPPGTTGIFRVFEVRSNPRGLLPHKSLFHSWCSLERLRRHLLFSSHRCLQMKSVDPPLIPSREHDFLSPTICVGISWRWYLEKSADWLTSRDNQGKSDQRSPSLPRSGKPADEISSVPHSTEEPEVDAYVAEAAQEAVFQGWSSRREEERLLWPAHGPQAGAEGTQKLLGRNAKNSLFVLQVTFQFRGTEKEPAGE